jgi:hypothetical protein
MEDARTPALEAFQRTLEHLLTVLEESEPGDALPAAWRRCDQAFEAFRSVSEDAGPLTPELGERLAAVRRLHAVATSLTSRTRDGVAAELETLSDAKRRLRPLLGRRGEGEAAARSCDVSG